LNQLCKKSDVQFSAIGALGKDLVEIPGQLISWSEETEVEELNRFDVGIMPLPDTPWERGKCGFKLIQYMACGLPVIASPVGVNKEIVEHGVNGFFARDTEEWIRYLETLKENSDLCNKMGTAGRNKVESEYSLHKMAPRLVNLMKRVAEG
jgi:glycosyltransferase involved in cell wall biosynthesis